ncbi:MAG: 4Fe-4S dicluster domain-containing protein [Gemmatimonadetes bacterium]|jgi:formate dehydrogenase iron-sulfur subunit|nr:4Fe-4S dicluster domain-containing protein [Gemmatimonadota bacterium]MBT6147395.1 4Fe-4S dicluster domain-containing protein [Gemmatimonadota bacterium]MBT7859770.1 4Fe-4S dicluster domain-containing protein [Gemmatimonadota bacterium]
MAVGILTDLTRCVGCGACEQACKEINGLPETGVAGLSASTWTSLDEVEGQSIRRQCMHCLEPACVSVCPVGALQKTDEGPVTYDEDKCMGCRYCMIACPFSVPKYEWSSTQPRVQKCIMCYDQRVKGGGEPACVEACPAKATIFGGRDELLAEARQRIRKHPERYVDHIYGLTEAGGTSVLYLSSVPFDQLGFPTGTDELALPRLTWDVLSKIPNIVSTGGVMMMGLWWIVNRREKLSGGKLHEVEGG